MYRSMMGRECTTLNFSRPISRLYGFHYPVAKKIKQKYNTCKNLVIMRQEGHININTRSLSGCEAGYPSLVSVTASAPGFLHMLHMLESSLAKCEGVSK